MDRQMNLAECLSEFEHLMKELNNLINEAKSNWERGEVSRVARKSLNLKFIKNAVNNLNDFVIFPEVIKEPGRPVKFQDSNDEKEQLKKYRNQGLSLRTIAEKTGMSKDMVDRKLKRYGIK